MQSSVKKNICMIEISIDPDPGSIKDHRPHLEVVGVRELLFRDCQISRTASACLISLDPNTGSTKDSRPPFLKG